MSKGYTSKKRKQALLEDDKMEAMGQDSEEQAAKWVIEENQNIELKKEKEYNDTVEFFSKKRSTFKDYYEAIATLLDNLLKHYIDYQSYKFKTEVVINRAKGVAVALRDPDLQVYARGFKPMGDPKYDLHAVKVLIWQTENIVDEYIEKQTSGTSSGESKDSNGTGVQKVFN